MPCLARALLSSLQVGKLIRRRLSLQQMLNGICGGATDNVGPQIWQQCFKQDMQGLYLVDLPSIPDAAAEDSCEFGPATSYTSPETDFDVLPCFGEAVAE